MNLSPLHWTSLKEQCLHQKPWLLQFSKMRPLVDVCYRNKEFFVSTYPYNVDADADSDLHPGRDKDLRSIIFSSVERWAESGTASEAGSHPLDQKASLDNATKSGTSNSQDNAHQYLRWLLSLKYHFGSFRRYHEYIYGHPHTSRTGTGRKHTGYMSYTYCNRKMWNSLTRSPARNSSGQTVWQWSDLKQRRQETIRIYDTTYPATVTTESHFSFSRVQRGRAVRIRRWNSELKLQQLIDRP